MIELAKPLGENDFILANIQAMGFYRINYDEENWEKIVKQLINKKDVSDILINILYEFFYTR